MKCLIILCSLFTSLSSSAQFPSEFWHEGKIVLVNSDTIRGNLKYDLDSDIIQINNQQGAQVYTAKKVLYFSFCDETSHYLRQFYALPFFITSAYKTPVFFEVLSEGKMTLLAREFVKMITTGYGNFGFHGNSYSRQVLAYRYYFLDEKGEIVRFHNKKQLYQILKRKKSEIRQFFKKNRIRPEDKSYMIALTQYYNSLLLDKKHK